MENLNQKPQQIQNQNPTQQEETFMCHICVEPANNKFKNINICDHPFCTDCVIKYIRLKLENHVSNIKCPATICNHSLELLSCRPIIAHKDFVKWCDLICESEVLDFDRAYCPNHECMELILNECGDGDGDLKRSSVCPNCKKLFCFTCKAPWHDGNTCGEVRDENDVAFDVFAKKKKWQRCPKCNHCVERISGCNFMTCRCGTQFSYKYGKFGSRRPTSFLADLVFVAVILILNLLFFHRTEFLLIKHLAGY